MNQWCRSLILKTSKEEKLDAPTQVRAPNIFGPHSRQTRECGRVVVLDLGTFSPMSRQSLKLEAVLVPVNSSGCIQGTIQHVYRRPL